MIPRRPLAAVTALAAAAALGGCVTHSVNPTLSRAVVQARARQDVAATVTCPDLAAPVSVGFAFGETGLSELAAPALEQATATLVCHPEATALVVGQADSHGAESEQKQLAQARIAAVAAYLRAHKVAATRLQSQALGNPPAAAPGRLVILAEGRRW